MTRTQRRMKACLKVICIVLLGLLFVLVLFQYPRARSIPIVSKKWIPRDLLHLSHTNPILSFNGSVISDKIHNILMYNPPDWLQGWEFKADFPVCPHTNCRLHENRALIGDSDAVVFDLENKGLESGPPVQRQHRNPDQAWIFFSLESPFYIRRARKAYTAPDWHGVFNWSWTYRTDSDIFHPYGILKSSPIKSVKNYSEIYKKKKKFAAWLVSHCKTNSKREEYVALLRKHVPVHVFGKCGNKNNIDYTKLFSSKYLFYISFENSLCPDYITEKLFTYSKMDLIPVVRGGGNYASYLPNGTYINAADFRSTAELAKFLAIVASNENLYTSYLRRIDEYTYFDSTYTFQNALCNVCEKLNTLDKHRKVYPDIVQWLGSCSGPRDLL